ncbi:MAG: hypothetical protein NTY02_01605, partial [Acidobacteria bacterium]|nr:hypothetical protein [Acidobacteriota bacterium]
GSISREAHTTLAIAMMGIEPAYATLVKSMLKGGARTRAAIGLVIWKLPDEEQRQLLTYVVRHAPCTGDLWSIHERALQRLGAVGDRQTVAVLAEVLDRRSFWNRFRMAALHRAAVDALAQIATPDARRLLEQMAADGPRAVRSLAKGRLALASGRPDPKVRA